MKVQNKTASIAERIEIGFRTFRAEFDRLTMGAPVRFANAEWASGQSVARARLDLYDNAVNESIGAVRDLAGRYPAPTLWPGVKRQFAPRLAKQRDYELAETFFNSVHRRIMHGAYVRDAEMFVRSTDDGHRMAGVDAVCNRFPKSGGGALEEVLNAYLTDTQLGLPWENLPRDVRRISDALHQDFPELRGLIEHGTYLEMARCPFYRNKGAYLVGRLRAGSGDQQLTIPITLPVLNNERGGAFVDALLCNEEELSIVFSFTRSYFFVESPYPSLLVDFLIELMPQKKRSELYAAIGFPKHGKTEFVRGFLDHLDTSDDQFVIAPGIEGMVMAVFMLESYQTVFKVIRDRFAPQKQVSRQQVKAAYELVKHHDRVGRMADTQEFTNIVFPRARFADALIEELTNETRSSVTVTDDRVVISHLYTERKMIPLNLYLQQASEPEIRRALDEYGTAIKQLAAANIFPGDMLLKNFGVTRHGRVVFYDYDEICYLTDVNFRDLPVPRNDEDAMSAEPWFSVAPGDVFPEEFERFLFGRSALRHIIRELHPELYDASYWRGLQEAIRHGNVLDVYPYSRERRFAPQRG